MKQSRNEPRGMLADKPIPGFISHAAGLARAKLTAGLFLMWLLPSLCQAQGEPEQAAALTLSITTAMASVGEEARYPVYLEGPVAGQLQSVTMQIQFPEEQLKFAGIEKGFLLAAQEIDLRTESKSGSTSVTVVSRKPGKGIPEGLLFHIIFTVDPSTPLGAKITLRNRARAVAVKEGKNVEIPVDMPDEVVPVSPREKQDELLFGCFFYMH